MFKMLVNGINRKLESFPNYNGCLRKIASDGVKKNKNRSLLKRRYIKDMNPMEDVEDLGEAKVINVFHTHT